MEQLNLKLSKEQFSQLKAMAEDKGQTISDFIVSKVFVPSEADNEDKRFKQLEDILLRRIQNAQVSSHSIQDITEDVINSYNCYP